MTTLAITREQFDMTINELINSLPCFPTPAGMGFKVSDKELLEMPVNSGCGIDCADLLVKANAMLECMRDADRSEKNAILRAVKHQLDVFYYG